MIEYRPSSRRRSIRLRGTVHTTSYTEYVISQLGDLKPAILITVIVFDY